nr:PREDICTED: uncharacterized protein LOC108951538 isoform X1 [Musa acuminata subsp. malaccensis]
MAAHGEDGNLIKEFKHVEFVQMWNLPKHKLEKVVSANLLGPSDHVLFVIHIVVFEASEQLEASLLCFKDPLFLVASVSKSGVFLFDFFHVSFDGSFSRSWGAQGHISVVLLLSNNCNNDDDENLMRLKAAELDM